MRISLNREQIKYLAVFAMVLNHIAEVFLDYETLAFHVLTNIGYFTAVTMCYFLVEGYERTRSREGYRRRLLVFAVLSELPFCLVFSEGAVLEFSRLNMIFSLFLCFVLMEVMDSPESRQKQWAFWGIILLSVFCDWHVLAPFFTVLFYQAKGDPRQLRSAYGKCTAAFGVVNILDTWGHLPLWLNLLTSLGGMLAVAASGVVILCFYNGKQAQRGKTFSKWFFYWFYPAHLLVLGLIRINGM